MFRGEEKALKSFIENKEYLPVAERLNRGGFFSLPKAIKVNKGSTGRKRTVFTFSEEEKFLQKFIAYKLLSYDELFSDNLYSFRKDMGVKKAIFRLVYSKDIGKMFSYKLDISDYFNSVQPEILLPRLKDVMSDNKPLFRVFEEMMTNPLAEVDGEVKEIRKGVLAGSPIAGFLANLYLSELDWHFEKLDVLYARYSDDIILFSKSESELCAHIDYIVNVLSQKGLSVNENKVFKTAPGEKWSFLGFCYENGTVDISEISKQKLKKKMRRKARALVRWRKRKNLPCERAATAFIRYFNKKLYANDATDQITWCRWYFPVINTSEGLKEIDEYMQQCLRYIATEKHNGAKYRFRYSDMKKLGYVTLVNSFYKYKNKVS